MGHGKAKITAIIIIQSSLYYHFRLSQLVQSSANYRSNNLHPTLSTGSPSPLSCTGLMSNIRTKLEFPSLVSLVYGQDCGPVVGILEHLKQARQSWSDSLNLLWSSFSCFTLHVSLFKLLVRDSTASLFALFSFWRFSFQLKYLFSLKLWPPYEYPIPPTCQECMAYVPPGTFLG